MPRSNYVYAGRENLTGTWEAWACIYLRQHSNFRMCLLRKEEKRSDWNFCEWFCMSIDLQWNELMDTMECGRLAPQALLHEVSFGNVKIDKENSNGRISAGLCIILNSNPSFTLLQPHSLLQSLLPTCVCKWGLEPQEDSVARWLARSRVIIMTRGWYQRVSQKPFQF